MKDVQMLVYDLARRPHLLLNSERLDPCSCRNREWSAARDAPQRFIVAETHGY